MVGVAFAALAILPGRSRSLSRGCFNVVLTPAWFEMPATCFLGRDKTATIGNGPQRGDTSSAQYLVDHIFVYRCNQNLPDHSSDI
jgi:hypothetical protein